MYWPVWRNIHHADFLALVYEERASLGTQEKTQELGSLVAMREVGLENVVDRPRLIVIRQKCRLPAVMLLGGNSVRTDDKICTKCMPSYMFATWQ